LKVVATRKMNPRQSRRKTRILTRANPIDRECRRGTIFTHMKDMQKQIASLQSRVKYQRVLNIVLSVLVVMLCVAAMKPYGVITCDGWNVLDKKGAARITAFTRDDGGACLWWYDMNGRVRMDATTRVNGYAGLQVYDKAGKQRVATFSRDDGGAGVAWCDANGKERITAGNNDDGVVMLPTKDLEVTPAKDLPDTK